MDMRQLTDGNASMWFDGAVTPSCVYRDNHAVEDIRKLQLRMPLHPTSARAPDSSLQISGLVERSTGLSTTLNRSRFQAVYQEFENMKFQSTPICPQHMTSDEAATKLYRPFRRYGAASQQEKGFVQLPGRYYEADQARPKEDCKTQPGAGDFADAVKNFMSSYLPTSSFNQKEPARDWSREAQNLLREITDYETQSENESTSWGSSFVSTSECAETDRFQDVWSKCRKNRSHSDFNIHQHIEELNPSPYPGASPASSDRASSQHSSDNDADDEEGRYSDSSCQKAIGTRNSLRRQPDKLVPPPLDSGYLSSSTESGGRNDESSRKSGVNSDSEEIASSTRPPPFDPIQSDDTKSYGALQYTMPPIFAGISTLPVPPAAHFLPPPPAAFMHPPTYMPNIAQMPPPGTNLALMTQTPQPYARQHFPTQQRPDNQLATGTYHKHKPWITDEILEMIAVRDRLYKRMKKYPTTDIVDMYKKVRNMVVGMTRNAKRSFEKRMEERTLERQLKTGSRPIEPANLAFRSTASRAW